MNLVSIVPPRHKAHPSRAFLQFRILSTRVAMVFIAPLLIVCQFAPHPPPPCRQTLTLIYPADGWVVQKETAVYWPVIILCPLGAVIMVVYSSILSYLVDGNPGRSSTAVACNSFARGTLAAVASQASEPLIDKIGNGWFYTGLALIIAVGQVSLLVASWKGEAWRERHQEWEREQEEKRRA